MYPIHTTIDVEETSYVVKFTATNVDIKPDGIGLTDYWGRPGVDAHLAVTGFDIEDLEVEYEHINHKLNPGIWEEKQIIERVKDEIITSEHIDELIMQAWQDDMSSLADEAAQAALDEARGK